MNRRGFLRRAAGATLGASAAMSFAAGAQGDGKRPNVIFILADDWGWGDLGCYGNRRIKTPNLDGLAKRGVLFGQFYDASAVCSPSRASFMTGRFTNRHGIHSHLREKERNLARGLPRYLDPNQPMLPTLLQSAGYATAHFGKWHLTSSDDVDAPPPATYGFDHHRITVCNGDAVHKLPPGIPGWNVWEAARAGPKWHEWRARASELIIDEAIHFIDANRNKPFYVNCWLFDTHAILSTTESQMEPYRQLGRPFRTYYGAATDSDRHIGRLFRMLDERRLAEDTVIIFSSDNGPEDISLDSASEHGVGDPGPFRGRKRSGYEGGIRLPFITRCPQGAAGKADHSTVLSGVDLLPTVCKLARVTAPDSTRIDGEDMSAVWMGEPRERRRPLFWDLREDVIGPLINKSPKLIIRDGRWKLLMNPDGAGAELYDIVANSLEVDNLADTHPDVIRALSKRLSEWKADPSRVPWAF